MVYFKENYNFPRFQRARVQHFFFFFFFFGGGGRGSNFFQRGVQKLISIETHRTCDFPGGSGPPINPSGSTHVSLHLQPYFVYASKEGSTYHEPSLLDNVILPKLCMLAQIIMSCNMRFPTMWQRLRSDFLSLKGCCTGSSESTFVKMPHCWRSHRSSINSYNICFGCERRDNSEIHVCLLVSCFKSW